MIATIWLPMDALKVTRIMMAIEREFPGALVEEPRAGRTPMKLAEPAAGDVAYMNIVVDDGADS